MNQNLSLADLGWQAFFQQQLSLDEWEFVQPARVMEQHKSLLEVATAEQVYHLPILASMPALTVGDWLLLDDKQNVLRALERKSLFYRKAAGTKLKAQLIAANIDTAFIVCSLNHDFNLNRIERYLSLINEAGAEPVVVLSKADVCEQAEALRAQVQALDAALCVEAVNGLDAQSAACLLPWCQRGQTVALLGSSGAGKSTLTNTLLGRQQQLTNSIRDDDSKGRHTTTRRSLFAMPNGALLLDTPGMRELQLADCESGLATTFADIEALAQQCRFADCQHESEPGCAVQAALERGELEERRWLSYAKLQREQALNAASLAERRMGERERSRYYKRVLVDSMRLKRGD